jgi:hypothetical protein
MYMETNNPVNRDPKLWMIAKRRAAFKRHLTIYVLVNGLLWGLWFMGEARFNSSGIPWPAWSTFGWGIGIFFNYMGAYQCGYETDSIEKEYQKLITDQNKQ